MVRKVGHIFVIYDGVSGKRRCPRCRYRLLYYLNDYRFGCRRCRYKFGEFTGTYIGEINFSHDILVHLIYLFALGVPAYRIRFYVPLSLTTIEKTFRVFRQSIYNESLLKLRVKEVVWRIRNR